jgi:hypothetical protein
MEGPVDSLADEKFRGMISRTVSQIFESREKLSSQGWVFDLTASFLEIYNDTLNDLLNPKNKNLQVVTNKKCPVQDLTTGIYLFIYLSVYLLNHLT